MIKDRVEVLQEGVQIEGYLVFVGGVRTARGKSCSDGLLHKQQCGATCPGVVVVRELGDLAQTAVSCLMLGLRDGGYVCMCVRGVARV
jgi:hypothetical protein